MDILAFYDSSGNEFSPPISDFKVFIFIFINQVTIKHSIFAQITIIPEYTLNNDKIYLSWTPYIKGVYKIFINGINIKTRQ